MSNTSGMSTFAARVVNGDDDDDCDGAPVTYHVPNMAKIWNLIDWATKQDLLRQEGRPSEWDQANWMRTYLTVNEADTLNWCGTACCMAGKTALDEGYIPYSVMHPRPTSALLDVVDSDPIRSEMPSNARVLEDISTTVVHPETRNIGTVWDIAREALDLRGAQPEMFFAGGNDVQTLIALAKAFEQGIADLDTLSKIAGEVRDEEDDDDVPF